MEIIVIDDNSDDGTIELLDYYKSKYKKLRYYRMETRKGAAVCRNFGNHCAKADIIMVCDSGDVNHKHRARDAYKLFKNKPFVDIYSTACIETNALDEHIELHYPRIFTDKEKPSLFHPTVTYRKKVTEKVKYREGNVSTDQYEAFFFEAYRAGFTFWHTFEGFVKKLRQNKNKEESDRRIKQRLKNYKEFGIDL